MDGAERSGGGRGCLRAHTRAELREEAAEAKRLAKESGTPAKSAKVISTLQRRWSDFLDVHGEACGFEVCGGGSEGPTKDD